MPPPPRISIGDRHCRYLACPASGINGPFRSLLKKIGLRLPPSLDPTELVRHGWIEPALRIELPKSFFLGWENFPSYSIRGQIDDEDVWASYIWAFGSMTREASADPKGDAWACHILDRPDHWITKAALCHQMPTDGTGVPESFMHPRPPGRAILPWVDFFAYWQVYHVAEIVDALYISSAPRLPDPRAQLESLLSCVSDLEELACLRLCRLRQNWRRRRETFEWLSRFRTMSGIWLQERRGHDLKELQTAAAAMVEECGLTSQLLKEKIRDHLLTLWSEWENRPPTSKARILLQQDVALAVQLVEMITGAPISFEDPCWALPADRQPREWAPLASVLPYETDAAKQEFPIHADLALQQSDFNQIVPESRALNEAELAALTMKWWPCSVAFRRFVLAYDRLHSHYFGEINQERLVRLEEETPIEFLLLCALHVEKLLGERLGRTAKSRFSPRVIQSAERLTRPYGISDSNGFLKELKKSLNDKTNLDDLPTRLRNPFVQESDFQHRERTARFFLKIFVNFAIMRNYAAHHDCLDNQLLQPGWVEEPVESLMVVTLTALAVSPVPKAAR